MRIRDGVLSVLQPDAGDTAPLERFIKWFTEGRAIGAPSSSRPHLMRHRYHHGSAPVIASGFRGVRG